MITPETSRCLLKLQNAPVTSYGFAEEELDSDFDDDGIDAASPDDLEDVTQKTSVLSCDLFLLFFYSPLDCEFGGIW
jgi:hypothetical protein